MSILAAAQVVGNIVKGIGEWRSAQQNAAALRVAAADELRLGASQEADIRYAARKAIGEQLAGQFSNGFMGGTGSALDALKESQVNAALDAMRIRRAAQSKSDSHRYQAKMAVEQGWFSLATSMLGAGSAAYNQQQDWAAARRGTTPAPSGGSYGGNSGSGGVAGDGTNMTGGISRFASSGY